jgi:hypothetical protein
MNCIICGKKMFYSSENLVHVCLDDGHGALCFFEPDTCWFAVSEETAFKLASMKVKFHLIPKEVLENAGLGGMEFQCDYKEKQETSGKQQ